MLSILLAIHTLIAAILIVLILIQRGKGAEIGAAFGSGASQTVFGARGAASFLTRTTALLATAFFATSLGLAYLYGQVSERRSVTELAPPASLPGEGAAPAADQGPADMPNLPESPPPASTPASDAPASAGVTSSGVQAGQESGQGESAQ